MEIGHILGCTTQPIPHTGGASTHLENLRDALRATGIALDIYSWNSIPFSNRLIGRFKAGVLHKSHGLSASLEASISLYAKFLGSYLDRNTPQAISIQTIHAMLACGRIGKARGLPKLLTVHGYLAYEAESVGLLRSENEREMLVNQEKTAYEIADLILAVDNRIRDHIVGLLPGIEHKVRVWPNAPGLRFIEKVQRIDKETSRKRLGLSPEAYIVLCPRRLVPKNGVLVAMRALKYLKGEKDLLLSFVGDGPLSDVLIREQPICMKDHVKFFGNIGHRQMPDYYRAADVVIIPSIPDRGVEEATSLSALEAAVSGIPIIATNIGGLRDIFAGTDSALLIPPNDEEALAQAIMRLRRDMAYALELGKRGFNLVKERFLPATWAKRFLAFIGELPQQPRP